MQTGKKTQVRLILLISGITDVDSFVFMVLPLCGFVSLSSLSAFLLIHCLTSKCMTQKQSKQAHLYINIYIYINLAPLNLTALNFHIAS